MTDRIKGLVVTLDRDYRDDDVEAIVNAIMMVRGVASVGKSVVDNDDYMNRARIVFKVRDELFKSVKNILDENTLNLT